MTRIRSNPKISLLYLWSLQTSTSDYAGLQGATIVKYKVLPFPEYSFLASIDLADRIYIQISTMADHTEIPPEILDLIIHELRNERKALLQCSLVSHDFVLPSRQNLFRTIELQNEHSCHTFKELLQAQPGIGHLVQALIISATPPSNISGLVWFTHAAEDVTYILRCLSVNLHSFHISSNGGLCSFELFPLHLQSALLALLSSPTLVKAEIGTIPRFPISHFATCPQLKDLGIYLRDVDTTISLIAPTPDDARAVGRLNVLQINTSDAAKALVIALTHPYSQLGLSELSKLWVGGGVAAECVWEILNIAQASLKELVWLFLSVHSKWLLWNFVLGSDVVLLN